MATNNNQKLAVLIDADNAQASVMHELLAEVSHYGTATIKRGYGDWTTTNLKSWKEVLHRMAIQLIQQFSHTTGKNSTDASLIIDAMDVLHAGSVDGFCLVSSDSDFFVWPPASARRDWWSTALASVKRPSPLWLRVTSSFLPRFCGPSLTVPKQPRCQWNLLPSPL